MMPWVICLGHAVASKSVKKKPADAPDAEKQTTFIITDRVPIHRAEHKAVWEALREGSSCRLFIDADHPEEAMPANVVSVAEIKGEKLSSIESALATARKKALTDEEACQDGGGQLSKALDQTFEQQREWLAIRNLLISAIPRGPVVCKSPRTAQGRAKRALILLDA